MKPCDRIRPAILALLAALGATSVASASGFNAPAPGPAQIEADWLRQDAKRTLPAAGVKNVTITEDAAGAVDGQKDGKWGFHTQHEDNPWWQVDLQAVTQLERVVLYNRCDGFAERNARIIVSASKDGKEFQLVYQHNGTVFYGATDHKPLVVKLDGLSARYLRLGLRSKDYFHLDEVEVYPVGSQANIALGKPATQSSVSQWSALHGPSASARAARLPTTVVIERGLKLAESQRRLLGGQETAPSQATKPASPVRSPADPSRATRAPHRAGETLGRDRTRRLAVLDDNLAELKRVAAELESTPHQDNADAGKQAYLRARWAVRRIALNNPLLNFDRVLFVKRIPTMFPHMSDQHYGWWSRGGGGIYLLENFADGQPRVRCLTADMPEGNFIGPDLSCDGAKVLFAYCRFYPELHKEKNKADKANVPEDAFYHVFEMNVDGTGRRQLTRGKYDDFEPRYLPDGDILFLSTRKGLAVQCTQWFSDSTREMDRPDSYVRCGGDNWRPVPVFTLHAIAPDDRKLRPLSAFENFEWAPSVAQDGRILYTRWDYIDRFNGHFFSLWSANQEGTNPQLVYGNYTVQPQVVLEARSVPGSSKLVFTASAHHSITGGSLCLLDRELGTEFERPLKRLTPEVCFPETEGWPEHYYAHPWPLSEDYFLVGWADAKLPPHRFVTDRSNPTNAMGIYLYDSFGNLELLYRDPDISSVTPIPVAPRVSPPKQALVADWKGAQEGRFLVQDVYRGMDRVPAGTIKQLRIVGVPPKVQPHMNNPVLGVSAEDPGKFVLGTAPVEADGSAHFRVPSGVPVFFQALDAQGLTVQTMRSLTYTLPGQTLACVGCHEHRDLAPPAGKPALAAQRAPSRLTPGPEGSWPLNFARLVQPVLDRQCVSCHRTGSSDAEAAKLDLTPANAWKNLMSFADEDLKKQAFERDRSLVGQGTAANSELWKLLTREGGHRDVKLDANSLNRLATWMDTYAHRLGHFSEEQERELANFRTTLSRTLLEPPPGIK